jgi:hypothetical protein
MAVKRELLHSLLADVKITGSAQVTKRKLLWMLDRVNENASAWAIVLDEWEEIGGTRADLKGVAIGENYTLMCGQVDSVTKAWASE